MLIEEHIQYWIESADSDLDTAEALFASGKYDWCLFLGHLVLEKILKAHYVKRQRGQVFILDTNKTQGARLKS